MLKPAALEVVIELPLNRPRQGRTLCRQVRLAHGIVFLDKLVKEGAFRAMALVETRTSAPNWLPFQPATAT